MNAIKLETQQKIIKAAYEVFIEKGLEGARMQEIADRAGINKALLHYYFRSKEHLFDAIFQETIQRIIPQFGEIIKSKKTIEEMLQALLEFYNNFFIENPYMPQFFFHEIWQNPDRMAGLIKSQEINPEELVSTLKDKLPPFYKSDFFPQHMMANTMGMLLFPHIARPLFQRLFFNNDENQYNIFLTERTDFLLNMFSGLMEGHSDEKPGTPDENF
jgi:TetR/AcrR family transcriptional regulator